MRNERQASSTGAARRTLLRAAGALPVAGALVAMGAGSASAAPTRFVPVPERARGPKIPAKGYLLDDFGGGVYGVRDGTYQSMFIVARREVIAVDAPPSLGDKLTAAIAEVTHYPVTHVVYSHSHLDHIGAAQMFGRSATYVAHERTGDLLRQAADPRRPIPTRTFSGRRHILAVGGQRLVLDYPGTFHQQGNLFIHAPDQKVFMVVDVVAPRWAPFFRLDLANNVRGFIQAHDLIRRYDFKHFVGGHEGLFGTRESIEESAEYIADLKAAAEQAFRTVDFGETIRDVDPLNVYAQFKAYTDALVARTVEVMPTRWLTLLGGADVFLADNASAMVFSMLIE